MYPSQTESNSVQMYDAQTVNTLIRKEIFALQSRVSATENLTKHILLLAKTVAALTVTNLILTIILSICAIN